MRTVNLLHISNLHILGLKYVKIAFQKYAKFFSFSCRIKSLKKIVTKLNLKINHKKAKF